MHDMSHLSSLALKRSMDYKYIMATFLPSLTRLTLITVGCIIWVYGMNSVLVPNQFLSGGVIGIALLVHYLTSFVDFVWIFLALNIPLLILGWRTISRTFMLYSIFGYHRV